MSRWLAWFVVFVLGCGQASKASSPLPSADFEKERKTITLPKADRATAPSSLVARVLLSSKYLLIEGDDFPIAVLTDADRKALSRTGLPARTKSGGAQDLFISQLFQGLTFLKELPTKPTSAQPRDEPDEATIVVLADRATSFLALYEIVHTAAKVGLHSWIGVVPDGNKAIPIAMVPPRAALVVPGRSPRTLALTVVITADGFSLGTPAGNIATGCEGLGSGTTIPKKSGAYDLAGLKKCLEDIRAANSGFDSEKRATLAANPATELQTVVDTMVVLGAPKLFPAIEWRVAR